MSSNKTTFRLTKRDGPWEVDLIQVQDGRITRSVTMSAQAPNAACSGIQYEPKNVISFRFGLGAASILIEEKYLPLSGSFAPSQDWVGCRVVLNASRMLMVHNEMTITSMPIVGEKDITEHVIEWKVPEGMVLDTEYGKEQFRGRQPNLLELVKKAGASAGFNMLRQHIQHMEKVTVEDFPALVTEVSGGFMLERSRKAAAAWVEECARFNLGIVATKLRASLQAQMVVLLQEEERAHEAHLRDEERARCAVAGISERIRAGLRECYEVMQKDREESD